MTERTAQIRAAPRQRSAAFTLIELLAVVALIGLVAAMAAPALDLGGGRAVRREAEDLASTIEFARQRAVMTGRPHRVVLDLDGGMHHVEWMPRPEPTPIETPETDLAARPGSTEPPLDLAPPASEADFEPTPGPFGRGRQLDPDVWLLEVELAREIVDSGIVTLGLAPDGSAEPAVVAVGDAERDRVLLVEVEALADAVRVTDAGL